MCATLRDRRWSASYILTHKVLCCWFCNICLAHRKRCLLRDRHPIDHDAPTLSCHNTPPTCRAIVDPPAESNNRLKELELLT